MSQELGVCTCYTLGMVSKLQIIAHDIYIHDAYFVVIDPFVVAVAVVGFIATWVFSVWLMQGFFRKD